MKKKYTLDIIMTILLILLMRIIFLNSKLHELIGLVTFGLFILHKFFNYKTIVQTIKNFKKIKIKNKIGFIIDIVILIIFILLFISSLFISNKIFNFLNISSTYNWSDLHHFLSYLLLIFISIHIGFHYNTMWISFKNKLKFKNSSLFKYTNIIISILIIVFGYKVMFNNNFYYNLLKPFGYNKPVVEEKITINQITFDEYIKDKTCDGCSKNCNLNDLKCKSGQTYLAKAREEYNKLYNDSVETNNKELNIFDYFIVMSSIVATTHYLLKIKKKK